MQARDIAGFFHFYLVLSGTSRSCEVGGFDGTLHGTERRPYQSPRRYHQSCFLQLTA